MRRYNEFAEIGKDGAPRQSPSVVATLALQELLAISRDQRSSTLTSRLLARTVEHLSLVGVSLAVALTFAIPLGALAARSKAAAGPILGAVGVLQTVPALALLVLLIQPFGIGPPTAIIALVLYSLLPIVRNTHAGLTNIPEPLIESARAIALTPWDRLRLVEFPLSLPTVIAGIKTAAVINVGTATLGGFISAGGYGQPIFTGITQNNRDLILEGAIPAAVLALCMQGVFDLIERAVVPRGLRK